MDEKKATDSYIVNSDGYKLYCRNWEPVEKPVAIVFISHGFTEHSELYETLGSEIAKMKCFAFAHDHVGHGRSGGTRVQIESIDKYVEDVFQHTDMMKQKFPDLPLFYIGHSMGGTIGARASIIRPNYFKGVVLTGPAVSISEKAAGSLARTFSRMLGWLVPSCPVVRLDYNAVSRDLDVIQKRLDDPLSWHGYAKAGWISAMLKCIENIIENSKKIECPLLLLHGGGDQICDVSGSKQLYEDCSSVDKCLKIYPKAFHNLLDEPDGLKEKVLEDITKWLEQRIK